MSESTESSNGTSTSDSTNQGSDGVKDPKAVLAKNQELLAKNKSVSEKAKALEDELNRLKTEKMQAEGKKDELIEALKQQVSTSTKRHQELGWNLISSQVAIEAAKKGCVNVDTLMKVVDFGSAAIDTDSFKIAQEDVNIILEKAVKDHSYLFKSDTKKPKDGGASHNIETPVDLSKMNKEQLLESYRKLAQKS